MAERGAVVVFVTVLLTIACGCGEAHTIKDYVSATGDPGMKRDDLRVALEAWNFCNEVGAEAPNMGSPRLADCYDIKRNNVPGKEIGLAHRVTERDNKLGFGDPLAGDKDISNVDVYAYKKELYLGKKCEVKDGHNPWQFWMIMLKNGNLDTSASLCPKDGHKVGPFPGERRFPCSAPGCMNQPLVFHNYTKLLSDRNTLRGRFYGTYDLDADLNRDRVDDISYYSVIWEKEIGKGGWRFHHWLKTSRKYPWLMLYLRADATKGLSGGYHYPGNGMLKIIPESPNFKVRVRLEIIMGGGPNSQFYLMDMGSCWKNNGHPCDGNVTTDVTRYSEMILNPETQPWCRPDNLNVCPPYHTLPNGTRIHRNNTAKYPYSAYHVYCTPGNAHHPEEPFNICDQYSNPQPQEILQILPHPVWGDYGYPTVKGQGWIGDPRTWELDVGRLSRDLYFYQEPGTKPAKRRWTSLDVGTEIYVSYNNQIAEWIVSDFDIIVPKQGTIGREY